jgi:chloramphenicol 3-O-phosphotransferase
VRKVVMITGMQAAGKTTVGRLLAARLDPPAAAFDGDVFYNMVVAGNVDMTADAPPEALRQVGLRYDAAALVARHYVESGFNFVYTDIVLGESVTSWMEAVKSVNGAQRHLVVLDPSVEAIVERERARGSNAYRGWQQPGMSLAAAVTSLRRALQDTPRRGLWIDTSAQTPEQTVDAILADLDGSLY